MTNHSMVRAQKDTQFYCNECQSYQPIKTGEYPDAVRRSHDAQMCDWARKGKILPAGLHNWFMAHRLQGTDLIYANGMESQVMWVRDTLHQVFGHLESNPYHQLDKNYKRLQEEARKRQEETGCKYNEAGWPDYHVDGPGDFIRNGVKVVSTHTSKSCKLPVYGIDYIPGLVLTLRGNFYNWQISVKSDRDLNLELDGLASSEKRDISHCYCEGFPEDRWSGNTYAENPRDFTLTVWGPEERVYTILWQIGRNFK